MACFPLAWLESMFVWVIVIFAVIALLKLLLSSFTSVPFWPLVSWPPGPAGASGFVGFIVAALSIVFWAVVGIMMVYFIFMLIGCLLSFTGGMPSLPHR